MDVATQYLIALVLGVVQGVAEFLPISSSGHLVICTAIAREFSGVDFAPDDYLRLNVALHFGTLLSIVWVYRERLWQVLFNRRLCAAIVLATLPLVAIGLTPLKDQLQQAFATPLTAGYCLLVTALVLAAAYRWRAESGTLETIGFRQAAGVGLFQAMALLPGISRSGSTISAGLLLGMERKSAADFSFLIAVPAISGAAILTAKDALSAPADSAVFGAGPLLAGAAVSCVVGLVVLRWLLGLIAKGRWLGFAWYCAAVGTATIIWQTVAP